jgi:hypothetical protein
MTSFHNRSTVRIGTAVALNRNRSQIIGEAKLCRDFAQHPPVKLRAQAGEHRLDLGPVAEGRKIEPRRAHLYLGCRATIVGED